MSVCCSLSLPPSDSFVVVRAGFLTEAATNCHRGLANQEFLMPSLGAIESNHARINITQTFTLMNPTPSALPCIILHHYIKIKR